MKKMAYHEVMKIDLSENVGVVDDKAAQSVLRAKAILAEATHKAQNKILNAREEAKALVQDAEERALNDRRGHEESLSETFTAKQHHLEEELTRVALQGALERAHRQLQAHLQTKPQLIVLMVTQILTRFSGQISSICVRANPAHIEALRAHESQIRNALSFVKEIQLRSDQSVLDGVVIETELGVVDADLETQLRSYAQALGVEWQG